MQIFFGMSTLVIKGGFRFIPYAGGGHLLSVCAKTFDILNQDGDLYPDDDPTEWQHLLEHYFPGGYGIQIGSDGGEQFTFWADRFVPSAEPPRGSRRRLRWVGSFKQCSNRARATPLSHQRHGTVFVDAVRWYIKQFRITNRDPVPPRQDANIRFHIQTPVSATTPAQRQSAFWNTSASATYSDSAECRPPPPPPYCPDWLQLWAQPIIDGGTVVESSSTLNQDLGPESQFFQFYINTHTTPDSASSTQPTVTNSRTAWSNALTLVDGKPAFTSACKVGGDDLVFRPSTNGAVVAEHTARLTVHPQTYQGMSAVCVAPAMTSCVFTSDGEDGNVFTMGFDNALGPTIPFALTIDESDNTPRITKA